MNTDELNSSTWYIPGFNVVTTPKANARVVTSITGEFSTVVYTLPEGEQAPTTVNCAFFDLEGCLLEAFLDMEGITTRATGSGDTEYVLTVPAGHVPHGDIEIRTYIDRVVHLSFACNNFAELDDSEAIELPGGEAPSGRILVDAGVEEVSVVFDTALSSVPQVFFSLQNSTELITAILTEVTVTGFTIGFSAEAPADLTVDWFTARF